MRKEFKQNLVYQMIVISSLSFFVLIVFSREFPLFVLISLLMVGFRYLQWKNYNIALEPQKLVLEHGVLSKHHEQIKIEKIQKIRMSHHLSHLLFPNVGNIIIETGNDLAITLENIENYKNLYEQLEKLTQK